MRIQILISGWEESSLPLDVRLLETPLLKAAVSRQSILFYFPNYSPSIAMELKVGKEITCK